MTGAPAPDRGAIREFLSLGVSQLIAIPNDNQFPPGWPISYGRSSPTIAHWVTDVERAIDWVLHWNSSAPPANIYWSPNQVVRGLTKKACKAEVIAGRFVFTDIDPEPGESPFAARDRTFEAATKQVEGIPGRATIIIFTGGGHQALWSLGKPVLFDTPAAMSAYEAKNLGIAELLAGDKCQNADRILRLPGTINWPKELKRSKGRVPTLTELVECDLSRSYSLASFPAGTPVVRKASKRAGRETSAPRPPRVRIAPQDLEFMVANWALRSLIRTGVDPQRKSDTKIDRSGELWKACLRMMQAGFDDTSVYAIITDAAFGISAHILEHQDPEYAADRTVERAREEHERRIASLSLFLSEG